MTKKISTFLILGIVLIGVLSPALVFGQGISTDFAARVQAITQNQSDCETAGGKWNKTSKACMPTQAQVDNIKSGMDLNGFLGSFAGPIFKGVGWFLMKLSSLILLICGTLFDAVVKFTIIDMSKNIGDTPPSIGASIKTAWATLRDIANMCFIFVLLFAAFKAMFQADFGNFWGKTVRDIIIIALLINFSLFFSKVVIDASNIVSVGFYKSIMNSQSTLSVQNSNIGNYSASFDKDKSITAGYMNMLGIQTIFGAQILNTAPDAMGILIIGVMSSLFMLITAVVLLISTVMFIARFIILIFLMILSPLALIAYVIPGQSGQFNKWKDALIDQSFFAPLFFALTWVVFKVGTALIAMPGLQQKQWAGLVSNPLGTVSLILNYVIIIGLAIAALIISKTMASKTDYFGNITNALGANKVAGVVGGASFGATAALGRRTVGAAASRLAQSRTLSTWAGNSWIGQKAKEGVERTAKSSFDVRQTKAGQGALGATQLGDFGKGKSGGYDATLAAQTAKKEKIATGLKTDDDRALYAQRQMGGKFTSWYKRGGSAPNHWGSLFGTMGRSNRIFAAKILGDRVNTLQTDLNNGNTELTRYQNVMNNGGTLNTTQQARFNTLNGTGSGSLIDMQNQITALQTQINSMGITNPSVLRRGQPIRADQQNF